MTIKKKEPAISSKAVSEKMMLYKFWQKSLNKAIEVIL